MRFIYSKRFFFNVVARSVILTKNKLIYYIKQLPGKEIIFISDY